MKRKARNNKLRRLDGSSPKGVQQKNGGRLVETTVKMVGKHEE